MVELKSTFKELQANLLKKEEELRSTISEIKVLSEKWVSVESNVCA